MGTQRPALAALYRIGLITLILEKLLICARFVRLTVAIALVRQLWIENAKDSIVVGSR